MKRLGTVLVFNADSTRAEAEAALKSIEHFLAPVWIDPNDPTYKRRVKYRIEEFDDDLGGPVWYLP